MTNIPKDFFEIFLKDHKTLAKKLNMCGAPIYIGEESLLTSLAFIHLPK